MQFDYEISLDIFKRNYVEIESRQYDDMSRRIKILVTKEGEPIAIPSGTELRCEVKKPDGTYVKTDCVAVTDSGKTYIAMTLTQNMLAAYGQEFIDIVMTHNNQILGTMSFINRIRKAAVQDGDVMSTSEARELVEAMEEAEALKADIEDAGGRLDTLETNLDAETEARKAAVTAEAQARAAADTAEAQTRASADTALGQAISAEATARGNAVTAEEEARTAAVTAEAQTRASADTALGQAISDEVTARENADTALDDEIGDLKSALSDIQIQTGTLKSIKEGYALDANGNEIANTNYKIIEFISDTANISITTKNSPSSGGTIRVQAFINGVFSEQVYTQAIGNTTFSFVYNDYQKALFKVSFRIEADVIINSATKTSIIENVSNVSDVVNHIDYIFGSYNGVLDGYALDDDNNLVANSDYQVISYYATGANQTIKLYQKNAGTLRINAVNKATGTFVSHVKQTIPAAPSTEVTVTLTENNYENVVFILSNRKTTVYSLFERKEMSLDMINGLKRTASEISRDMRVFGKWYEGFAIDENTGNMIRNANFNVYSYYATSETQEIVINRSGVVMFTLRVWAYPISKEPVQLYAQTISTTDPTVTISISYADYENAVFKISMREGANISSISKLSDGYYDEIPAKAYLIDTYLNTVKMQFCAHRGARLEAPENSLPAYEIAGQEGYEWLNLAQLRQSADGTWYVMHDASIDRTTDGTGNIKDLTDSYLSTVHIDTGAHVDEFTPEELVIPTLEDAIKIGRKYGMKLYFRIGAVPSDWSGFVNIIRKYRCEGMLFGGNSLNDVLHLSRLGFCVNWDVYSEENAIAQIQSYVNNGVKNATLFTSTEIINDALVQSARSNGFKVMAFDPSESSSLTKEKAQRMSDMGVDIVSAPVKFDLSE